MKKRRALILYSRIPSDDILAKTRAGKGFTNQSLINEFEKTLIWDMIYEYLPTAGEYDFIFYHKGNPSCVKEKKLPITEFIEQMPGDISIGYIHKKILDLYEEVIVVGQDIPCLKKADILWYFDKLSEYDITICPLRDGGYGLVGMRTFIDIYSNIDNWDSRTIGYRLLEHTLQLARQKKVHIYLGPMLFDIDNVSDMRYFFTHITKNTELLDEFLYLKKTYKFLLENKREFLENI